MAEEQMTTEQDNPTTDTLLGSSESDNQSTDWRANLPEDLKNDPTLQNINDPESAAKTLIHQQKMMGNRIPIPKTDEEKAELYTKLGRPESADKYELNIPQEHQQFFPENAMNEFKNVAHNLGLNNEQANALFEYQSKEIQADIEREKRAIACYQEIKDDSTIKISDNLKDQLAKDAERAEIRIKCHIEYLEYLETGYFKKSL